MFQPVEGFTILGTGLAVPPTKVDNAAVIEAARQAGAAPVWGAAELGKALGVQERYWTHPIGQPACHDELTSQDLAIAAARHALEDAGLEASALTGIVMVTTTPPRPSVCTANHVAKALGARGFALELKSGCTGALYGLAVAAGMVATGVERVLVVAAEAWSKLQPPHVPGPGAVAGDGAGAVVIGRGTGAYLGGAFVGEPTYAAAMMPPGLYPATPEAIARHDYTIRFSEEVAEPLRALYPRVFEQLLANTGLSREAIALLIPHQASGPILRRAIRDLGVKRERAFHTLPRYGNVSSASVLMSLHTARAEGRLAPGQVAALVGAGGGLTAGAVALRI